MTIVPFPTTSKPHIQWNALPFSTSPFNPLDQYKYLCKQGRSRWAVSSGSTLFASLLMILSNKTYWQQWTQHNTKTEVHFKHSRVKGYKNTVNPISGCYDFSWTCLLSVSIKRISAVFRHKTYNSHYWLIFYAVPLVKMRRASKFSKWHWTSLSKLLVTYGFFRTKLSETKKHRVFALFQ